MNDFSLRFTDWDKEDFRGETYREEWANRLGVVSRTLNRYEQEILDSAPDRLPQALYWRDRRGRQGLDYYQKTILFIINKLRTGEAYPNHELTYTQIQDWFSGIDEITGKKRILSLTPAIVKEMLR